MKTWKVEIGHRLLLSRHWNFAYFSVSRWWYELSCCETTVFQHDFIQLYCYGIWVMNFWKEFV
jgi:hypothetical protein